MDLRHLDHFLAVVDHGGVTRAAAALFISQPALSQSIRNLERDVGTELFDRGGRQFALTAAGAALVESARRIHATVELARDEVTSVTSLRSGRLDIATLPRYELTPLPEIASRFRRRHPGVILTISAPTAAAEVIAQVRRGAAEIAIIDLPADPGPLDVYHLATQEICLVLPPSMADGLPDPVPRSVLATLPLVLAEPISTVVPGVDAHVAVECDHWPAVVDLVRLGAGATLLPRRPQARPAPDLIVRAFDPPIHRDVGVGVRAGRLSPAATAFLQLAGVDQSTPPSTAATNARPAADSADSSYTMP